MSWREIKRGARKKIGNEYCVKVKEGDRISPKKRKKEGDRKKK